MAKIDELIKEETRHIGDLKQVLIVATNERDYDRAVRTQTDIEAHERTLDDLLSMRYEEPPEAEGVIPCAKCGALIFHDSGPLCDNCRENKDEK